MKINLDSVKLPAKNTEPFANTVVRLKDPARVVDISLNDLEIAVCEGRAFTPGVLEGASASDWTQQQVFVLDFDNDVSTLLPLTPQGVFDTLTAANIPVAFMYYSYSHKPEHEKFRAVMVCSEIVTDPAECKRITQGIMQLFPTAKVKNNAGREIERAQVDLSCFDLARFFYGTNKGLVDGCKGTQTFTKAAALSLYKEPQPERVSMSKIPEQWPAHNKAAGVGFDLGEAIRTFDLLGYITSTTGSKPSRGGGKDVRLEPCPICGKKERFQVDTQKSIFQCFGDSCGAAGNIINFLQFAHGYDEKLAREHFKYQICGIAPQAERREYAMQKKADAMKATLTASVSQLSTDPLDGITVLTASEISEKPTEYNLYPHSPKHAVIMFVGIQGGGKSWLTLDMAAAIANGRSWGGQVVEPDKYAIIDDKPGIVMMFNAEDDPERTTAFRINKSVSKYEQSNIKIIPAQSDKHIAMNGVIVKALIKKYHTPELPVKAIFFDPVQAYLPEGTDQNCAAAMRKVMTDVLAIAREAGITIILVQHMNKDEGKSAVYRGMGSNEYSAAARCGLFLGNDPEDESGRRKVLAFSKANWLPPDKQVSVQYEVDLTKTPAIQWLGASKLRIDDISSARRKSKIAGDSQPQDRPPSKKERARDFIENYLIDAGGYADCKAVVKAASMEGFTQGVIYEGFKLGREYMDRTDNGAGRIVYWYIKESWENLPIECRQESLDGQTKRKLRNK